MQKLNLAQGFDFAALAFDDPRFVKKHVKQCRAWRFECIEHEADLEFQIYFSEKFSDLLVNKKISKLTACIKQALSDPKFHGHFVIDVVPDVKAIIITSKGFWQDYSITPDSFANAVEQACERVL